MKLSKKQVFGVIISIILLILGVINFMNHGLAAKNVVLLGGSVFILLVSLCADHLYVFGYGLPIIFTCIGTLHYLKHDTFGTLPKILLPLAVVVFLISIFSKSTLEIIYKYWMKGAHFIGNIVTSVIMAIVFYLVFAPVGIVCRILKKDFLHRTLDPNAKSYWHIREKEEFDKQRCTKQF